MLLSPGNSKNDDSTFDFGIYLSFLLFIPLFALIYFTGEVKKEDEKSTSLMVEYFLKELNNKDIGETIYIEINDGQEYTKRVSLKPKYKIKMYTDDLNAIFFETYSENEIQETAYLYAIRGEYFMFAERYKLSDGLVVGDVVTVEDNVNIKQIGDIIYSYQEEKG
tara:strand:+ start:90 stop:584 length:495 start_codon:yes stop_codon:yes gene_type:complete